MAGQQGAALVAVPDWTAARPGGRLAGDPPAGHPAGTPSRPGGQGQPGEQGQPGQPGEQGQPGEPGAPGADWPHRFAAMLTEALAGARPARHVLPWTTKRAQSQFDRLLRGFADGGLGGQAGAGGDRTPRIRRVVATCPAPDAIEMSVVAGFGPRTRALALRLERPDGAARELLAQTRRAPWPDAVMAASGGWICTDIEAA